MKTMKREKIIIILTASAFLLAFAVSRKIFHAGKGNETVLKIGFVYDGDESTPYTYNFIRSQHTVEEHFGDRIKVIVNSNINPDDLEDTLDNLISKGCSLIFTTNYSHAIVTKEHAQKYPKIQFCQACGDNANSQPVLKNFHTFMGEIYQGRYVTGIVAGLKLQELIESGIISENQAKVGYVGAYPYPEVISGFTAFFMGVRSVVPSATMTVNYTYTWSSFSEEKAKAQELIDEGCIIISQHSDTIGPAVACEENFQKNVFHIGYNQSMIDIAPRTSLVSTRINWTPYIQGAVQAMLDKKSIEKSIKGHIHGTDIGAGFDLGWVQIMELNSIIAAPGTDERIEKEVRSFQKGRKSVFQGNFTGVNPYNDDDIYDFNNEYKENADSSAPTLCYIIKDLIKIIE